jgi:hypothetical protein
MAEQGRGLAARLQAVREGGQAQHVLAAVLAAAQVPQPHGPVGGAGCQAGAALLVAQQVVAVAAQVAQHSGAAAKHTRLSK